ncbi:DUF1178 family protein [Gymnodinialimonas hymeniacidonis]|uniref:DUF1178 family protein n=1 Tax=Gymnodinialimonas hymeniacidonis TaxID=3126508 RepID=UPI0034C65269
MIRYTLKCAEGHRFESWFQSADAFDTLHGKGMVSCAVCGIEDVQKAMMAPPVPKKGKAEAEPTAPERPLSEPAHPAEAMLRQMREHVEKNSTYVGGSFAKEARAMHLGDTPERAIHGEANAQEAKSLIEDGVPILPLPGPPPEKAN